MRLSDRLVRHVLDHMLAGDGHKVPSLLPMTDPLYWFGWAVYDALAPLHGEPKLIERWPTWPAQGCRGGQG